MNPLGAYGKLKVCYLLFLLSIEQPFEVIEKYQCSFAAFQFPSYCIFQISYKFVAPTKAEIFFIRRISFRHCRSMGKQHYFLEIRASRPLTQAEKCVLHQNVPNSHSIAMFLASAKRRLFMLYIFSAKGRREDSYSYSKGVSSGTGFSKTKTSASMLTYENDQSSKYIAWYRSASCRER